MAFASLSTLAFLPLPHLPACIHSASSNYIEVLKTTMDPTCSLSAYVPFCRELQTLLVAHPPEFIYVQDTESTRTTAGIMDALLRDISQQSDSNIHCATVDGVACFTARLFYESVINALAGWTPTWEDGCGNWNADSDVRWNENIDTFLHGLRAVHSHLSRKVAENSKGTAEDNHVRLVIVVQRADRLKDSLPDLIVPLTRLAELTRLDICVIFVSQMGWEHIKPPLGASPDPYYMDVQLPSKEDIVDFLITKYATISQSNPSKDILKNPYHMALKPLYEHFAHVICNVCFPFTHNPEDLQYIAAARWPGFSKPLLDEYRERLFAEEDPIQESDDDDSSIHFGPLDTNVKMRLMKAFNPTLTNALDMLLPRLTNATDWSIANEPRDDILMSHQITTQRSTTNQDNAVILALPRMSQYILLASFLASTNPAKSDLRMFGRGVDATKRKRRINKNAGKSRKGGPSKVAQQLLGPQPFPLDRMIAILGSLLEENDSEEREGHQTRLKEIKTLVKFQYPGEETDMEITRLGVYTSVVELSSKRLLHRTSPADRLDGPPMFKVAISYDTAQVLAKHLKVELNQLVWDPVN